MSIRRNKDGQQNLTDLRAAIKKCPKTADVYKLGRNWQIRDRTGVVNCCPWYYTERQALQQALFENVESGEESRSHAAK